MIDFKGSQFEKEIIMWGVRWYVADPISCRQWEEMRQGRGVAVEVLSPNDTQQEIDDKVDEYLSAGVALVWVIDPKPRTAAVHRSLTDVRTLGPDDALDGEDVLPGFRCALAEVVE